MLHHAHEERVEDRVRNPLIYIHWKTVVDRVFTRFHIREVVGDFQPLWDVIESITLARVERISQNKELYQSSQTGDGLWVHSLILIFQTTGGYWSIRIPTVDPESDVFFNGIVDNAHTDIVALTDLIVNTGIFTDSAGNQIIQFCGGYYGIDITQNQ